MTSTAPLTLRHATPTDAATLETLAHLDGRRPAAGPHLIAESGGRAVAALSLRDGQVTADPFLPTLDAVALLRRRAAQLEDAARPRGRRRSRGPGRLARRLLPDHGARPALR